MDSTKYKLVTHKGMTVPRGYAEGTLTPYEAVVYLEKLGIDESLYYDVTKAVLRVPSGYRVTSPSNNVTEAGGWVNSADDETTWEQFEQNAPTRRWKIEYDESLVYDELEEGESGITPDQFTESLMQAMGLNYTIADIREAGKFYAQQLEAARQEAQGDEEQLARISEAEEKLVENLNELAKNYYQKQEAEKVAAGGDLDLSLHEKVNALVEELGDFTAYIAKGKGYVKSKDSFPITLRDVKGSKVQDGRRDLNLGSLAAALAVANTPASLATLERLVDAARAHRGGKQAPVVTVSAKELFTNISPEKGYLFMLETMHPGAAGETTKEKIMAGLRLSNYMREEDAKTIAEKRDKLKETELLWKMEANLQSALRGESSQAYIEAVSNLNEIQKAKEFLDTVYSGNAAVQVVMDLAIGGFDTPQYGIIKKIFEEFDTYLRMGDGSVTFSGMLKAVKPTDEDLAGKLQTLRETISQHIKENPINTKSAVTAGGLTKLHNAVSSSLLLDSEGLVYHNLLIGSSPSLGDESVRKIVGKFKESTWDFTEYKGPELARNLSNLVRRMKGQGKGDSQMLADPKMAGAIETEVRKLGYDEPLTKEIVSAIQRRAEKNSGLMAAAFGDSLSGLEVRDAAQRGAVALLIAGLQKHINGESEKFDMSGSMARLVTRVLSGNFEGYAPEIGSFFAGTQAVFAEILNRARVLPRLDNNDNVAWGGNSAFRDAVLNDYLKMHPESTGQIVDDVTLLRHASHTRTEFYSHYLLVGNIHSNAEFITGASGERLFTNEREIEQFTNAVESVNLSNPENTAEIERVASSVDVTDRITKDVIGTKSVGRGFVSEISSGEFDPESYREVSLSSAAAAISGARKGMRSPEAVATMENFKRLVSSRVSEYTQNQSVIDYITEQVGKGGGNGGTTGHAFEIISGIPSLINHIQETGMVDASVMSDGIVDGIFWKGSDGKSHSFGKIEGALNGTVDFMRVSYGEKGVEIYPVEGKMEKEGGAIPHHGNPEQFSRVVAELWKKSGKGKVRIFPPIVTNAPHGASGATGSGIHSLSMDFSARTILTVGRVFNKGRINKGTDVKRMMV